MFEREEDIWEGEKVGRLRVTERGDVGEGGGRGEREGEMRGGQGRKREGNYSFISLASSNKGRGYKARISSKKYITPF